MNPINLILFKTILTNNFPDRHLLSISNTLVVDVNGERIELKNRYGIDISNINHFVSYNSLSKWVIDIDSLLESNVNYDINLFPPETIKRLNTYIQAAK